ncbi:hypothetical protein [Micromonospora sp. NPDC047740]|uniref:hypothetical protein n=1 Tax=Micromonospora sp. NPDC047740 TaxID=3364254 RepID=UPI00371595D8
METSPGRRSRPAPSPDASPPPADDTRRHPPADGPAEPTTDGADEPAPGTRTPRAADQPGTGTPPPQSTDRPHLDPPRPHAADQQGAGAPLARTADRPGADPPAPGAIDQPGAGTAPPRTAGRPGTGPPPPGTAGRAPRRTTPTPGARVEPASAGPDGGPAPTAVPREPGRRHRRARSTAGDRLLALPLRRRRAGPAAATGPLPPGKEAGPPPETDADGSDDPPERSARRRAVLVALGVTAAASAAALVAGLLSWSPEPADPARPLTAPEAELLAAMRVTNQRDVRAGVRGSVGTGDARTEFVGWVDWARPLVYLDVGGPGAGTERGLVQANRSALVVRPDPAAAPSPAPPPLVPPADRWRLREPPAGRAVAAVRDLLLGLSANRTDPTSTEARWLGQDTAEGSPVDIFQASLPTAPTPTVPPTAVQTTAVPTAAVPTAAGASSGTSGPATGDGPSWRPRLWLDRDARLHRLEGRLPDDTPITVELARSDRPTLRPVDALGGRPGLPRALADGETDRLVRLPDRLRASGGATLTLTAPLGPTANLRAAGWLSWAQSAAYLALVEVDTPGRRTLLRWRSGQVARAEVPGDGAATEIPAAPPLPPPTGVTWPADQPPADDLDRLLDAALRAGSGPGPAGTTVRVRDDRVADRAVDVIEVRSGATALRWWIDRSGLPRRLELRTGRGVWAQLDLTPGRVPVLPATAPGPTAR